MSCCNNGTMQTYKDKSGLFIGFIRRTNGIDSQFVSVKGIDLSANQDAPPI